MCFFCIFMPGIGCFVCVDVAPSPELFGEWSQSFFSFFRSLACYLIIALSFARSHSMLSSPSLLYCLRSVLRICTCTKNIHKYVLAYTRIHTYIHGHTALGCQCVIVVMKCTVVTLFNCKMTLKLLNLVSGCRVDRLPSQYGKQLRVKIDFATH